MTGMNRHTGAAIDGEAHLAQSVADILTTPIGSRVARRDYGSLLPDLIDQPLTPALKLRLYGATAVALSRWEPRLRLQRVTLEGRDLPSARALVIEGQRRDMPAPTSLVRLTIPLSSRSLP